MNEDRSVSGLFVGMTTLDVVYRLDRLPSPDEKMMAGDRTLSAGGPATNAAAAFAHLGGRAHLVSALGRHALAQAVRDDLRTCDVTHTDLTPSLAEPPVVSAILVTRDSGERAVVSTTVQVAAALPPRASAALIASDVVLVDGHQMPIAIAAAEAARAAGIPVVFDGGSWKPRTEALLRLVDHAVCSEVFRPPGVRSVRESLDYLLAAGVRTAVATRGPRPILYAKADGHGEVPVDVGAGVVDTMGAGDVFHGAYCYYLAGGCDDAHVLLERSAAVATASTLSFGTRAWMSSG